MKVLEKIKNTRDNYQKIIIYVITFLTIYFILLSSIAPKEHSFTVGDISTVDVKAPRDTVNERATKEKEKELIDKVDKQYTLKSEVQATAVSNIEKLFDKVSNVNSTSMEEAEKIEAIKKVEGFSLNDEEIKQLIALSSEDLAKVRWLAIDSINLVYEKNIAENSIEDIQIAKNTADSKISSAALSRDVEEMLRDVVYSQIKPNYFYDKELTDEKIREVQKNAPKVMIKKNETIIREGEAITEAHMEILDELSLLDNSSGKSYYYTYFVLGIYILVILLLQFAYLKKKNKEIFEDNKLIIMISAMNIIPLALGRGVTLISPYLIPIACMAILATVLIDYKAAIIINLLNLLLLAVVVDFEPIILILAIVSTMVISIRLNKVQQRNDILATTIYTTVVAAIITFSGNMLISNNFTNIFQQTGFVIIGTLLSGVLAIGFLPIFESLFDVVTNIKLLELSNPNHPLLKKLLMEAPGTYHHSMMVGNLAELAAEEIGGNPVIARIGAYYHDIGKVKRPYFFGENQIGKENPHNKITAKLSTLIIISHVKDGVEFANEYKLPRIIKDMIEQHHGTTLVKYFYYTIKNNSENPEEINEEEFRYPGPKPKSKEAGILMLADSVEAAVRSINEPTKVKIEDMVNNIIKDKLNSEQLNECDLTFRDLEVIRKCFLKALDGIYHQRIEYPTEKKITDKESSDKKTKAKK